MAGEHWTSAEGVHSGCPGGPLGTARKGRCRRPFSPEMLWGRDRGRRIATNMRMAQPWNGEAEDPVVAVEMDARSPTGFKAGGTRNPKMHRNGSSEVESADLRTKWLQKLRNDAG